MTQHLVPARKLGMNGRAMPVCGTPAGEPTRRSPCSLSIGTLQGFMRQGQNMLSDGKGERSNRKNRLPPKVPHYSQVGTQHAMVVGATVGIRWDPDASHADTAHPASGCTTPDLPRHGDRPCEGEIRIHPRRGRGLVLVAGFNFN